MQDFVLKINGMHCNSCVNRVTRVLEKLDGVRVKAVTIGMANVAYDPEKTGPAVLVSAVNAVGFQASEGN